MLAKKVIGLLELCLVIIQFIIKDTSNQHKRILILTLAISIIHVSQKERVVNVYANQNNQNQTHYPSQGQSYVKYSISKQNTNPINIRSQYAETLPSNNIPVKRPGSPQIKNQGYIQDMPSAYQTHQDDDKHSVVSTHSFKQYGLTINVTHRPSISKSIKNDFEPKIPQNISKIQQNLPKIPNKSNPYHTKQNKDEYLFDKPMNIVQQNIYTKNTNQNQFYPNQSHVPQIDHYETQSVQFDRSEQKNYNKKFKQEFQINDYQNNKNIPRVKSQVKSFQPQQFVQREQINLEKEQQKSFKKKQTEVEENEKLEKEIKFDGGKYIGQIFDDNMNGRGTIYDDNDKIQYEGGFKDGNFDGYGRLYNHNNEYLNLDCSEDLGMAELSWILYEGLFENNQKQGVGYLHFSNKDTFCGEFKNDKANGFGIYSQQNTKVCGIWQNNILVEKIN